ncbi:MAG: FG-GAP repeat domain-containing protein, partial [Bradymonadaceae bacterium]
YENTGGSFGSPKIISTSPNGPESVHTADVDGDGDPDALSASIRDDTVAWYENTGGSFGSQKVITTNADRAASVHTADLDGDGDPDA